MSARGVLRTLEDGLLSFYCKGCEENHIVRVVPKDSAPCWGFNGDYDKPTFIPSILLKTGHYCSFHKAGDPCWCDYEKSFRRPASFECVICHSFITDGNIQYLTDCTHKLAGQTIPLEANT